MAIRRWLISLIDARFRRKLDEAGDVRRHDLAKELKGFENEQALATHVRDKNVAFYESYNYHFGRLMANIVAFRDLRETYKKLGILDIERGKLLEKTTAAIDAVAEFDHYSPLDFSSKVTELYAATIDGLLAGADETTVDALLGKFVGLRRRMRKEIAGVER